MSGANAITPVPLGKISLLGLILAVNNTSIWMIFSFLPFMVSDFYPELSTTELGYKAGILGSSYSAGAIIGNFISGFISDKYGRRPALLLGLFGTAIASLSFGFSAYFWTAVLSRFLWGLINGNIGVAKTYLSEICDDTNVAKAMSYFGIVGGVGRTIGPMIGGFLSTPAKHFPSLRKTVFDTFPFALPSLVISTCCFIVFSITYLVLPETLPINNLHEQTNTVAPMNTYDNNSGNKSISTAKYSILNTDEDIISPGSTAGDITPGNFSTADNHQGDIELSSLLGKDDQGNVVITNDERHSSPVQNFSKSSISDSINNDSNKENYFMNNSDIIISHHNANYSGNIKKSPQRRTITFSNLVKVKEIDTHHISFKHLKQVSSNDVALPLDNIKYIDDAVVDYASDSCTNVERVRYSNGSEQFNESQVIPSEQSYVANIRYLLKQPQIIVSTTLYGFISFVATIISEIFPLWVVTDPEDGGFSYDAALIGLTTMICGIIAVVLQLFLYPLFMQHLGVIKVTKYSMLLFSAAVMLLPSVGLMNSWHTTNLTWFLIILIQSLQNWGVSWSLVSTFILINNSCYSHQRATVNAIGQTCASVARMIGPYLGSLTFAWSDNNHLRWPLNYYFTFYFLGLFSIFIYYYISLLPRSIQRRKREPKLKESEEEQSKAVISKVVINKECSLHDNDIENRITT